MNTNINYLNFNEFDLSSDQATLIFSDLIGKRNNISHRVSFFQIFFSNIDNISFFLTKFQFNQNYINEIIEKLTALENKIYDKKIDFNKKQNFISQYNTTLMQVSSQIYDKNHNQIPFDHDWADFLFSKKIKIDNSLFNLSINNANLAAIRWMLNKNIDFIALDQNHNSSMHRAVNLKYASFAITKEFTLKYKQENINLDLLNHEQLTPFFSNFLNKKPNYDSLRYLYEQGANLWILDQQQIPLWQKALIVVDKKNNQSIDYQKAYFFASLIKNPDDEHKLNEVLDFIIQKSSSPNQSQFNWPILISMQKNGLALLNLLYEKNKIPLTGKNSFIETLIKSSCNKSYFIRAFSILNKNPEIIFLKDENNIDYGNLFLKNAPIESRQEILAIIARAEKKLLNNDIHHNIKSINAPKNKNHL